MKTITPNIPIKKEEFLMSIRFKDEFCSHEYTINWPGDVSIADLSSMSLKRLVELWFYTPPK
jgi:hypothetical protein